MFNCKKLCDTAPGKKLEELLATTKLSEILHKKEEPEQKKAGKGIVIALAIIGAVAAVAAIAYFVYKWMNPDYLEDFEDYEDDDDDDDEDDEKESEEASKNE